MSLDLIHERIRTRIAPYITSLESVLINYDSSTLYYGYAKAGTRTSEAKWLIFRVQQVGNSIYTRFAKTSANTNDQELMNKVLDNAASYNYVD